MHARISRLILAISCCVVLGAAAPLVLQEDGSFFVGGKPVHAAFTGIYPNGAPTEAGTAVTGQTYVQFRIPAERNAVRLPLLLVHGGRHSGATYETTPDGREGWATYFVRNGFATYVVDAPGVGRSGFDGEAINKGRVEKNPALVPPVGIATMEAAWPNFRIGAKYPEKFSDTQFPLEAVDVYAQQWVPSVGGSALSTSWPAGLASVLDKIGPSVLFTHSASGGPGGIL